ncbi:MAG TPA: UvrB/UvrC motif-containing protein [Spirochaetota bacterium]|jgi:protein arginine kinase activator|nr:UvrB/UvrC motif-containing protein [Spirochaetota bacterium]HOK92906.1 UvrB/UvrC motif-containing protein [Spirochaetota bacterium]HON15854.1 UvrB/UvrC motif-containing protein [Spirochaetota bacterium]HPD78444.1 UvrB/UvrC motif-containing protein [Spirochaetota bacterium]
MLCDRCKTRIATIHLAEIIKDVKSEVHLCEVCARDVGFNTRISDSGIAIPDMLSFLNIDEIEDSISRSKCSFCGTDFIRYKQAGKLGCPECYVYLENELLPVINSLKNGAEYCGKFPANVKVKCKGSVDITERAFKGADTENEDSVLSEIERLKEQLKDAVSEERYEDAANLRDRIRELEQMSRKA